MDIYKNFVSGTLASNGNQRILRSSRKNAVRTGCVFIRVSAGGEYEYTFAFSDAIDSTFGNGNDSHCNDLCTGWKINSLQYAVTSGAASADVKCAEFAPLYFGGEKSAAVNGIINTDPVRINVQKDAYICLKICFSGKKVPYHHESTIALFRKAGRGWKESPELPVPVFTGVKRQVKRRVGFIGDSITQGCGTTKNGYKQYAAVAAQKLGEDFAFWDMGLGYARGSDAATDGGWLNRAKQNDITCVCFGVNDILQGHDADTVKKDLETIVDRLKEAGVKVILQTVPPFDYDEKNTETWLEINRYIKSELREKADAVFDTSEILSADGVDTPRSKYGSHPNDEGHRVWGEKLAETIKIVV